MYSLTSHLITGGNGFIGRYVARALVLAGDRVTVVGLTPQTPHRGVSKLVVDLVNAADAAFDRLIGGHDIIHHYLWTSIPASANEYPVADICENLKVTFGLLKALKRRGGGTIIFSSSGGTVYGRLKQIPVSEEHPLNPITAYGVSKLAAEKYLQFFRYMHNIDARVVRISNPYGVGQSTTRPQGVVASIVQRALAGQAVEIWGDGTIVRDFVHVADLSAALLATLAPRLSLESEMPIFNVGSGVGYSLNQLIESVESLLGKPIQVRRKPARKFDVPAVVLDISKAMQHLGWAPRIELVSGLEELITSYKCAATS